MSVTENDRLRFAAAVSAAEARVRAAGGIGTLGERTLHAALKLYYEPDTDLHEIGVGRYVADIKNADGITEIQTRGFSSLGKKLDAFLPEGQVTVVYPLAAKKWIAMLDPETGTLGEKHRSPKKETPLDALWELSFILPHLGDANLTVRLPMLEVLEFRRRGGRRWKSVLALPLLVFFALFTGASPSVVRAAVMEGILLLGNLLLREYDSWTALTVALFVLLAQNPFAIGSIGLQLSFASVVGIRLFMPTRQEREEVPPKWKQWLWRLWQSVALTLSAMVFTLPLSVYYFDNISLIAPLANLAVLWCIPLLMGGGFLTGLLAGVALPLAKLLALPISLLANGLTAAIHWFSLRPFAALDGTSLWMRLWLLFTYLLLLLYYLGKPKGWKVAGLFGVSVAALVTLVLGYRQTMSSCAMTTQVLDVGQGQCVLFVSQDHAAVVDCGGSGMNSAGDKLGNQLELLGIRELDALILTHYDSDHINGLEALLERTRVTQVIAPTPEADSQDAETVKTLCARYDIPWNQLKRDETLSVGAGRLEIYAPLTEGKSNESGLAVVSTVHDFDVLLTGDMDKATEKKLLKAKPLPDVEVLVAGHHGSSYSTGKELLDATTPEAAVISVGEENSYGHPGQATLDRLKERNIAVYRTDLEGTITIQED